MTSKRASESSLGETEKKDPEVGVKPTDKEDPDAEFGGHEARKKLERRLLRKLDARMCILVVIYILNYVCLRIVVWADFLSRDLLDRSTATMQGAHTLCMLISVFR